MAELHWFPAYVDKWMSSAAINAMLPEQEGAFWRLLLCAWGNGDSEPSLPANDAALAQMSRLGKRWSKLGPLVREQFAERDGKLYNAKLSTVWQEQTKKRESAAVRGSAGGKAKHKLSSAKAQLGDSKGFATTEKEIEGTLEGPTDPSSSPSPIALGAEAPRSGEARLMDESGTSGTPTTLAAELEKYAQNIIPLHKRRA